jgi:hypothetical protein
MMKKITIKKLILPLLTITTTFSILIYARQNGIVGRTQNGPTPGCTCHSSVPSNNVTVTIAGPDEIFVNDTASYSVTITGGTLSAGGTNIAAAAGNVEAGSGLRKESGELTHSQPKTPQSGSVTFEFTYIAPSTPRTDTLFANGLSVGYPVSANQWNYAMNKIINVTEADPTDVKTIGTAPFAFQLFQNYPNPFNPRTTFKFRIPASPAGGAGFGFVSLKIFNAVGKEVAVIVNEEKPAGEYKIQFDASDLSSGIYFYQLSAGDFQETKKFVILK